MTEYLITFNDEWVPDHTAGGGAREGRAARAVLEEIADRRCPDLRQRRARPVHRGVQTDATTAVDTAAVAKNDEPAGAPPDGLDAKLVGRLVAQARAAGLQVNRRSWAVATADQTGAGVGAGR